MESDKLAERFFLWSVSMSFLSIFLGQLAALYPDKRLLLWGLGAVSALGAILAAWRAVRLGGLATLRAALRAWKWPLIAAVCLMLFGGLALQFQGWIALWGAPAGVFAALLAVSLWSLRKHPVSPRVPATPEPKAPEIPPPAAPLKAPDGSLERLQVLYAPWGKAASVAYYLLSDITAWDHTKPKGETSDLKAANDLTASLVRDCRMPPLGDAIAAMKPLVDASQSVSVDELSKFVNDFGILATRYNSALNLLVVEDLNRLFFGSPCTSLGEYPELFDQHRKGIAEAERTSPTKDSVGAIATRLKNWDSLPEPHKKD